MYFRWRPSYILIPLFYWENKTWNNLFQSHCKIKAYTIHRGLRHNNLVNISIKESLSSSSPYASHVRPHLSHTDISLYSIARAKEIKICEARRGMFRCGSCQGPGRDTSLPKHCTARPFQIGFGILCPPRITAYLHATRYTTCTKGTNMCCSGKRKGFVI